MPTPRPNQTRFADPAICARCASQDTSCCRLSASTQQACFPISVMEWERILDVAGEHGAFVQEPNSPPFLDIMHRLFPGEKERVEALFPHHKFHLRLATTSDGACVFLGSEGCALPQEARPYYCRLFPFWMEGERLSLLHVPGCLAQRTGSHGGGVRGRGVMKVLGMRESEVLTLHGRLRLAWGFPPRPGMPIPPPAFARTRPS